MDLNRLLNDDPDRLARIALLNSLQHRGVLAVDDDIETLGCVVRLRDQREPSADVVIGSEDALSLLRDVLGARTS